MEEDAGDNDELFMRYVWPTKGSLALFPAGIRDPHYFESPTPYHQDLSLCRT